MSPNTWATFTRKSGLHSLHILIYALFKIIASIIKTGLLKKKDMSFTKKHYSPFVY